MKAFALSLICAAALLTAAPLDAQEQRDALRSYRVGRDLEATGRWDDALIRYDEAVAICLDEIDQNAGNMDSYAVLTWALLRQKKYQEVVDWGRKGLSINPNDYRIIESLGEAYFYLDDYDASLKSMQEYIDAAPQGERASVAYFFMGEIYRLHFKPLHADIAYTTAVNLESGIALWWYRLGLAREMAGEAKAAAVAFERALKLNPEYKEALDGLDRVDKQRQRTG